MEEKGEVSQGGRSSATLIDSYNVTAVSRYILYGCSSFDVK